jgi:hypothetical protein
MPVISEITIPMALSTTNEGMRRKLMRMSDLSFMNPLLGRT